MKRPLSRLGKGAGVLAVLTLATAGLFKIAAFAREAFIASRFGLSSFTDAYFAFQQFPLMLAAFMFGAFGLAFVPAYASEKRETGRVAWLPGLTVYGGTLGVLLTLVTMAFTPWFLRAFSIAPAGQGGTTLLVLGCSFAPVIWLGIWAGITIAEGRNLRAMLVTGLPYLSMTALLVGLYALGKLNTLSLPITFLAGFGVIGLGALPRVISAERPRNYLLAATETWKMPSFRRFLRQLTASSIENLGYSGNQLLLVYFVAQVGTGAVSANTCAMRVGMLGLSLLSLPLAQLMQAKFCTASRAEQAGLFRKWLPAISSAVLAFAVLMHVLRAPITTLVYLHGKFSAIELSRVTEIIPSWVAYFVVASLNAIVARYLFAVGQGKNYVRRQLYAYGAANLVRIAFWGRLSAPAVIWCSVVSEGCALLVSLRSCFQAIKPVAPEPVVASRSRRVIGHTPEPGAGAGQYVTEFVKALATAGVQVILFCPGNFGYEQEVEATGAEIVHAPMREIRTAGLLRRVLRNIAFTAGAARAFWAIVKKGDIVHFQFAGYFGLGLLHFGIARIKRASIVLTVHDPLPHRWILPRPFRFLETALLTVDYSLCSRLIVHNEAGKQILAKRFRSASSIITVIPHGPLNPIPPGSFDQQPRTITEPLRLLAFGSLRENKGLHLSIAAVQQLQRDAINRPVVLTIAGLIPNLRERAYWKRCLRLIEVQPAGIEVLERNIDEPEIASLFAAHDAVLLPYVDFYSESGVAMLALSRRRPILATSAGGLGELLREADCGICIESPTVDGVISAITKAASAPPALLRRKGLNGYSYALTHRSWKSIAERTREVYDGLTVDERENRREQIIVLHTPEPGSSAALYVEELSVALAVENVPVTVVCPSNHQARGTMESNPLIDVRVCCERATSTSVSLATKLAQNLRFVISSCRTLLKATKPGDIVHFQYILHLPFGLIFFICAWAKRAHIVFTVHDPVPHKFLFPRILRAIETGALRLAYAWSDVLVVHSEAGKRKLVNTFHVSPRKIRIIVHGPYQLKEKVRACAESDTLEALFFGSLRENKGLHLAIEATQRLAGEGVPIRLTIAGQVVNRKEHEYWQRCRTLIDSASGSIRLREGFVPDSELADLFAQCHCFVLPYTTFSSDSGVAFMALANAKPIVSTDAGGLGWLLENSSGGILIPEASVRGVTRALRQAADLGPEILERMGRNGARWVSAECGWRRVARDTRDLYAEFIPQLSAPEMRAESAEKAIELVEACHE
ncbi:MAG: glycosyltransferase [Bryobacteraceae bacterium]